MYRIRRTVNQHKKDVESELQGFDTTKQVKLSPEVLQLCVHIKTAYNLDVYRAYVLTITFKPDVVYSLAHPFTAQDMFMRDFRKLRKSVFFEYYMVPELSVTGMFHYHGLIFMRKSDAPDPEDQRDDEERSNKIFLNHINREYGRNLFQRIGSYTEEYPVQITYNKLLRTDFSRIMYYLHKDQTKYRKVEGLNIIRSI